MTIPQAVCDLDDSGTDIELGSGHYLPIDTLKTKYHEKTMYKFMCDPILNYNYFL